MKIGIRLPTLMSQTTRQACSELPSWAVSVEAAGFDSAWFIDHLLAAEYVFGSATLDPVVAMANIAGATTTLQIGTAILVAPLRQRLWLAKQLGTLSAVAGERILLGLGAGWDEREFQASGVPRGERGKRLDLVLEDIRLSRATGELRIDGVPIDPAPSVWGGVLVGGGGSATVNEAGRPTRMAASVVDRIARADGWFVRSSAPLELWTSDLEQIRSRRIELGRSEGLPIYRSCFLHVSHAGSREAALAEQMAAMSALGWRGDREAFIAQHPYGTTGELLDWFNAGAEAGVGHVVIHPVGDFRTQLQRIQRYLLPALAEMAST